MKYRKLLPIGVTLILGFIAGTMSSTFTLEFLDSSAKASLLTHELRMLRAGDIDGVIKFKEGGLDGAIYNHLRYKNGIYPLLAWPISMQYDHEKYMYTVLEYREEYPSIKYSENEKLTKEKKEFWEEKDAEIEAMLITLQNMYKR